MIDGCIDVYVTRFLHLFEIDLVFQRRKKNFKDTEKSIKRSFNKSNEFKLHKTNPCLHLCGICYLFKRNNCVSGFFYLSFINRFCYYTLHKLT